jgi:hypothetical protein
MKESSLINRKYYQGNCRERLRKITKNPHYVRAGYPPEYDAGNEKSSQFWNTTLIFWHFRTRNAVLNSQTDCFCWLLLKWVLMTCRVLKHSLLMWRTTVSGRTGPYSSFYKTNNLHTQIPIHNTGCFINPSGISEVCSSGAKSHTGDESMSVKRVHIQVLNVPYKCSICPPLVTRQTSIL